MAQRSRSTFQKREREKALQQKQRNKDARRLEAKERKANRVVTPGHEDPDIAGIKPGPQPLPEQWQWAGGNDPPHPLDKERNHG